MEFDHATVDTSFTTYMDSEYLRYPDSSPASFDQAMDLPPSPTFPMGLAHNLNEVYYAPPSPPAQSLNSYATLETGISPPSLLGPSYTLTNPAESSSGRRGSGSLSPPIGSYSPSAAVPRSLAPNRRFNPMARPQRRKTRRSDDSDDEDEDDFQPASHSSDSRRETIRRQRIESEQRRRDELRDGYARLKETLPSTNQKSSKVSLLDRATNHVRNLEIAKAQLEKRLEDLEASVKHLRHLNEVLSVRAVTQPRSIATF
ncbi:unnamed protein product [Mycena citricolor]|uniref:BHLH domain-containing protein n=1 Tax=Mycena citricolor TaxID=2018698 RepID=A0AAD2K5M9_9AGAR|nr:unnamed protein product [Mycena citricolor]CAK5280392.1 unnamed protein product [Mycena citricolor]